MRVNTRVFDERQDLFSEIYVKGCPTQFEKEANRLLNMIAKPGYAVGDYNTMSQLDKKLMVDYWREYDGLQDFARLPEAFKNWFVNEATTPELIRRARQWLVEHNYLIIKSDVRDRADEAGDKFRMSMRK